MTQDTYRSAYDEATVELRAIVVQFEALHQRKVQLEGVIEALRPLIEEAVLSQSVYTETAAVDETAPFLVQQEEEMAMPETTETVLQPTFVETSNDPFQQRIDNALRHGFTSRDSRVLSLGLNGLLTRA